MEACTFLQFYCIFFLFLLCLVTFILASYSIKWLLLHVLFNRSLFSMVVSYLFDFRLISQQFHSTARQISFSFSLAVPVNELSRSESRLITTDSGIASLAIAFAQY